MKTIYKFIVIIFVYGSFISSSFASHTATNLLLIDGATNVILREQNANKITEPASIAKLMTILIVLQSLKQHKITLNQEVTITQDIWRKGGAPSGTSTMFAALNSTITVENLLKALIIDSANDAAIALANLIAGDEKHFAVLMNNEAKQLAMQNTLYVNATGLPEPAQQQKTNLADSLHLLRYLRDNYPIYNSLAQTPSFTWNKITQSNKNFLLKLHNSDIKGLCGITAYNKLDHFMFVGCATKDNREVYIAFSGALSKSQRSIIALDLLKWSYNNFSFHVLLDKNIPIVKIPVFAGTAKEVSAVAAKPIYGLANKQGEAMTKIKLRYKAPLIAPIQENSQIGTVALYSNGELKSSTALIAKETIKETSFYKKFKAAFYQITIGWIVNLVYYHLINI